MLKNLIEAPPSAHGTPKFDRLTKSKTVEDLYPLISDGMLQTSVNLFKRLITSSTADGGQRKWAADQIAPVLRHHIAGFRDITQAVIADCVAFFCQQGFFTSDILKETDQSMLREKLFSLLSILISDTKTVWASDAIQQIEKLEENNKRIVRLDSEIKKLRKSGLKTIKRLRSKVLLSRTCSPVENEEQLSTIPRIRDVIRISPVAAIQQRH